MATPCNCIRVFLIAVNLLFMICGVAMAILTLVLHFNPETLLGIFSTVPEAFSGFENYVTILLGVLGTFVSVVSLLGLLGACIGIRILLCVYAVLVSAIAVAELVILIYVFVKPSVVESGFNSATKQLLLNYDDVTNPDVILDSLFLEMQCCGFRTPLTEFNFRGGEVVPYSCCTAYNTNMDRLNPPAALTTCVTSGGNIHSEGCYSVLVQNIDEKKTIIIPVVTAILIIEATCVIFAFMVCAEIHKNKKVKPKNENSLDTEKSKNDETIKVNDTPETKKHEPDDNTDQLSKNNEKCDAVDIPDGIPEIEPDFWGNYCDPGNTF